MNQRRTFLKGVGSAVSGAAVIPTLANGQESDRRWKLSIDSTEAKTAPLVTEGFTGEYEGTNEHVNTVEVGSESDSWFDIAALLDGSGVGAMNGMTCFRSTWEAPSSGTYTLTADYWGYGGFEPGNSENWRLDVDTTVTSGVNLAVFDGPDSTVNEQTFTDMSVGNETLSEQAKKKLLQFLATRLIAAFFGTVGGLIASFILTGVQIVLNLNQNPGFRIDPLELRRVEMPFTARRGETYDVQFTPSVGFCVESKDHNLLGPGIRAKYNLRSFFVREGEPENDPWSVGEPSI